MQIEIQGQDAIKVAQEIVTLDGVQGDFEVVSEIEREGTLATIATIIGITTGAMTIAEKLYDLNKKSIDSPDTVVPTNEWRSGSHRLFRVWGRRVAPAKLIGLPLIPFSYPAYNAHSVC